MLGDEPRPAIDGALGMMRALYPEDQFFGLDRNRVFRATDAQLAWARRGRVRRLWDWICRRRPPPGPRLTGFRFTAKFTNGETRSA